MDKCSQNFLDWLSWKYRSVPEESRYHLRWNAGALMRQYDVADWVSKAVDGPYELAGCVCMWHSIRAHYRRYVKSVRITVLEDGVNKVYIAQSTAKSTILERINVESLMKSYMVYAPWQEFSMHELRDDEASPLKYARLYALGRKIHFLDMNLGQWIRSRSGDGPFVQYEMPAEWFRARSEDGSFVEYAIPAGGYDSESKTEYRGEEVSLQKALKAVPGITSVQWSIIGFSRFSLGYLDQYVQEIPVSGIYAEESFSQQHYLLRRTDGQFVYPEDWFACDEALLQQEYQRDFNVPPVRALL